MTLTCTSELGEAEHVALMTVGKQLAYEEKLMDFEETLIDAEEELDKAINQS